jgi:hypothetical protein
MYEKHNIEKPDRVKKKKNMCGTNKTKLSEYWITVRSNYQTIEERFYDNNVYNPD